MLVLLSIVVAGVFLFLFFSRPRIRFSSPNADIETKSGRTTLFHYRSQLAKTQGVIVLVHGFCENHMYFHALAEPLTAAGFDCIAINLFGYGGSIPNIENAYNVKTYARQLTEALKELKRLRMIKQLTAVWGHSMGGATVTFAASDIVRDHPEIRGLFLENPGYGNNLGWLAVILKRLTWLASFAGTRFIVQIFANLLFAGPIKHAEARRFITHIITNHAPIRKVAAANVQSVYEENFVAENLSENAARRLHFVASKNDKLISFKKTQKIILGVLRDKFELQESQLLILGSADHFVALQSPKRAAEFVLQRLQPFPVETLSDVH
jgi:pimeloyl-ACP methyl ester carboxylesterase